MTTTTSPLTDNEEDALRAEARGLAAEVGPDLEDCAGCRKRGNRCAIHGTVKREPGGPCPECNSPAGSHLMNCTAVADQKKPAKNRAARKAAAAAEPPRELAPALVGEFKVLDCAKIRKSKRNPRRRKPDMEGMVASVRVHGVTTPIEVRYRPDPKTGTDYELTAGECRWTASELVGRTTIPAMIVECDDETAFERRILENLQRNNIEPIDEAEAFKELRDAGRDVEYIAHKSGKSTSWVYARLKLAELPELARDKMAAGTLAASTALLIARIPSARYQVWATREVLRLDPDSLTKAERELEDEDEAGRDHLDRLSRMFDTYVTHQDDGNHSDTKGPEDADQELQAAPQPMSVREAQAHLQRQYMTRLELATFKLDDATLVPEAGSCTKCTHRTGNQRELFSDVKRADVCTNPPCFDRKTRAAFEAAAAGAVAEGARILEPEQTKKIFTKSWDTTSIGDASPYVEPDAPVPYDLLPSGTAKRPTWEKLLGKKGLSEVPRVVAQDGAGHARNLITRTAAVKMLRESGKLPKATEKGGAQGKGGGNSAGSDWALQEKKREAKEAMHQKVLDQVLAGVEASLDNMTDKELWNAVGTAIGFIVENGDGYETLERLGGKKSKGFSFTGALVAQTKTANDAAALVVKFLIADLCQPSYGGGIEKQGTALLKAIGVNWDKLIGVELDAAKKAEAAKKAADTAAAKTAAKTAKKGAKKK